MTNGGGMPLLWFSLLFIAGVFLAPYLGGVPLLWFVLAVSFGLLFWLSRRGNRFLALSWLTIIQFPVSPLLLLTALFMGGFRYQQTRPLITEQTLAYYNDVGRVQIAGKIIRPADPLEQAVLLEVAVDEIIQINDVSVHLPVQGRCMVRVIPDGVIHYGDQVIFSGPLQTPPEGQDFDYGDYLARKGIYSYMLYPALNNLTPSATLDGFSLLYGFRERAYQTINAILPQPEAGLLSGILIGLERDIPASVQDDFQATGTSHIVAISGFNIALVAGLLTVLLDKAIGKRLAPLGVIGGIILYTLLVGAQAAVVRAAIMGSISLFGRQIGRRSTGINTLLFTASLMTWQNPLILADVGFQLSFSATLGLVLFAGPWQCALTSFITKKFSERAAERLSAPISEYFLFTFAAQLTTLPVILYHFGRFSISSFIANPLILPVQPLIMILGGPLVLLGMLFLPLGQALAWLVWPLLYYTIHVVAWVAKLSGAVIPIDVYMGASAIGILILILGLFLLKRRLPVMAMRLRPGVMILILLLANSFLWREIFRQPDGMLHLSVLPQGDCTVMLIESPGGKRMLINGGNEAIAVSASLAEQMPIVDRNIDLLLIPQNKNACLTAIPRLMERFAFAQILYPPQINSSRVLSQVDALTVSQDIDKMSFNEDLWIDMGDDVFIKVIPSQSGTSLSQYITWQNFNAVLIWDGYVPCLAAAQESSRFVLYLDARKDPRPLQEECAGISAMFQAAEMPLANHSRIKINLSTYEKLTITTDGEQVWVNGAIP
jgi:competence protein ComEC